ncbi:LD-carboxypeptidase [Aquitalea denitrificans]|uniref:LD-carboxypeptidase n=1 Tax=Aquitalea denitrificans TaxID=519081 RepID=UPI00135CE376|nr:LD-carboxypeptidase [Aquitalea denitrificans]
MPSPTSHPTSLTRRKLLQHGLAAAGAGLLQACGTAPHQPAVTKSAPATMSLQNNEIALLACSGTLPNALQRQHGVERLQQAGFNISNRNAIDRQYQRFAGSDQERLQDLNQLTQRQDMPRMLLAGRGGYGACRLLADIDYARLCPMLKEAGTQIMGYSDFTAIQLAMLAKGGIGSFAGPMLYSDFGGRKLSPMAMQHFIQATTTENWTVSTPTPQANTATGEGIFWGGNLSVLSSLVGSPFLPDIQGGLLFLEDVAEQPYRLERMLQQLYLAGILQRQKAIFLGDFAMGRIVDAYDAGYTLDSVIAQLRSQLRIPVLTGIPFGHIHDKTTLPLGYPTRFSSDENGLTLSFSDYPVQPATGLTLERLLPEH